MTRTSSQVHTHSHSHAFTQLRRVNISVIGAGKMGQALIRGLLAQGVSPARLRAADPSRVIRRQIARRFRIAAVEDNAKAAEGAEVVILAVKPQQMPQVIAQLAPRLAGSPLVVSIAAGITLSWLERRLRGRPVIRVMPNLPATVGCGFSAVACGRRATGRHRRLALELFKAVGDVVELPERSFDAITAVSGSGPAYVFLLVQVWEEAARRLGVPPQVAARAIRRTLEGSVRLLQASRLPASALVSSVASKGGTTEAALHLFTKRRLQAQFCDALRAAARRSKELSWSSRTN